MFIFPLSQRSEEVGKKLYVVPILLKLI